MKQLFNHCSIKQQRKINRELMEIILMIGEMTYRFLKVMKKNYLKK